MYYFNQPFKKNQTKLSEEQKPFIVIGIPFCDKSENKSY